MDEVFEVRFAGNEEILTDTGEHSGTCGSELCCGNFKGKLFAFGGADEAELDFDFFGNYWSRDCFVIHTG